ncbi:MAG: potassium transporter TrkA [Bryobacteraceae bacterium]|nr:MAG: potassium transporter TrkA [Bryobacteraceae bacterium]
MPRMARRVLLMAAAVAGVLTLGTLGYVFIAGYPWLDAIYMAVMTMTTVGYGEIHPLGRAARLFNTFYIAVSVSTMLMVIGIMTQAIFEAELRNVFGRRRMRKMLESLRGHYIVCGFGRVGRGAAAELRKTGAAVVVVDRDERRVERAQRAGCLALPGDATSDESLQEAGIARAAGLVAALSTDADNLFVVMSARTLNPSLRIAARAAEEETERKMLRAGADTVLAPYKTAGAQLALSLIKPHVRQFLDFALATPDWTVRIEQVEVAAASDLVGKSLAEARIRGEMQVVVLGIRRASGGMEFNPPASAVIGAGDCLIVMGEAEPLRRFEIRAAGGAER